MRIRRLCIHCVGHGGHILIHHFVRITFAADHIPRRRLLPLGNFPIALLQAARTARRPSIFQYRTVIAGVSQLDRGKGRAAFNFHRDVFKSRLHVVLPINQRVFQRHAGHVYAIYRGALVKCLLLHHLTHVLKLRICGYLPCAQGRNSSDAKNQRNRHARSGISAGFFSAGRFVGSGIQQLVICVRAVFACLFSRRSLWLLFPRESVVQFVIGFAADRFFLSRRGRCALLRRRPCGFGRWLRASGLGSLRLVVHHVFRLNRLFPFQQGVIFVPIRLVFPSGRRFLAACFF